ncbi:MAG: hypothetical protein ACT4PT_02655 [Methanobacteriota archaeon]
MRDAEKRRYVPAEGYRYMVLAALDARTTPMSKGDLSWEVRANHYMLTRVLTELSGADHVRITPVEGGGYAVSVTDAGRAFLAANRPYFEVTFREALSRHFQYGTAPRWASGASEP